MTRPPTEPGMPGDLPASLAAGPRELRRGLPIPPVNEHPDPHGGPGTYVDFTTLNTTTSTRLAAGRVCSLCGESMEYWVNRAMLQQMQRDVGCYFSGRGR